jgi:hypothetical protein
MKLILSKLIVGIFLILTVISCKKSAKVTPAAVKGPYNVLILGNSITYSPMNPAFGWNCSCGMAASVPDSDFVHLLTARFKLINKSSVVVAKNIAEFERSFDIYDFADTLKPYRDAKPDLIILRIGENVTRFADSVLFEKKYVELINFLKINNPAVKILAAGSVWPDRDLSNEVMSKYSNYISLISIDSDYSNFSFGLFKDPEIQNHPGNKGMKAISDQIWVATQKLL